MAPSAMASLSKSSRANTFTTRSTPPFSTTLSAAAYCRGGAQTTACGPTTSLTAIQLGQIRVRLSPGTWATSPPQCVLNLCGKTSRDFTAFRCQVPSKDRQVSHHIGGVDCDPRSQVCPVREASLSTSSPHAWHAFSNDNRLKRQPITSGRY